MYLIYSAEQNCNDSIVPGPPHRGSIVSLVTEQGKSGSPRFQPTTVFSPLAESWLILHATTPGHSFLLLRGNTKASWAEMFGRRLLGVGGSSFASCACSVTQEQSPALWSTCTWLLFSASPSYCDCEPASSDSAQSSLSSLKQNPSACELLIYVQFWRGACRHWSLLVLLLIITLLLLDAWLGVSPCLAHTLGIMHVPDCPGDGAVDV